MINDIFKNMRKELLREIDSFVDKKLLREFIPIMRVDIKENIIKKNEDLMKIPQMEVE